MMTFFLYMVFLENGRINVFGDISVFTLENEDSRGVLGNYNKFDIC